MVRNGFEIPKKFKILFAVVAVLCVLSIIAGSILTFLDIADEGGGGLIGGGTGGLLALLAIALYYVLMPKSAKEYHRSMDDERGKLVKGKAATASFMATSAILAISTVVFTFWGEEKLIIMSVSLLLVSIVIFYIAYFYYKRKL